MGNEGGGSDTSKDSRKASLVPDKRGKSKTPKDTFNVEASLNGMNTPGGPVTKMRMWLREENRRPELNIDIDLVKDGGEDENFRLSTEPNEEELEKRQNLLLEKIECKLVKLRSKLEEARRLRKDWAAQQEGLCNRKLKDLPK